MCIFAGKHDNFLPIRVHGLLTVSLLAPKHGRGHCGTYQRPCKQSSKASDEVLGCYKSEGWTWEERVWYTLHRNRLSPVQNALSETIVHDAFSGIW